MIQIIMHGRNFGKCGGQLGVKPILSSGRRFVLADDLPINIPKFVSGHGTVVQHASINIIFGCKQAQQYIRTHQLGFIRAVSWSAQNAESRWSHVHIILTVEHFSFHAFYMKCGLQHDFMSCSSRLKLKRR